MNHVKVRFLLVALSALALIFSPQQTAAHPTYTGEQGLFGISTSDTLDRGEFSFGFYLNNWDRKLGDSDDSIDLDITTGSFSLYYGVFPRLEAGIQVQYLDLNSREEGEGGLYYGYVISDRIEERGFGDIVLGLKFNLLDSQTQPIGLGIMGRVKFPTADKNKWLGTGETDYGIRLILSKPFDSVAIHANAGYTIIGDPAGQSLDNVVDYGIGFLFPVDAADKNFLQFIAELKGANDPTPDLPDYLDLTMGVRYHFKRYSPEWQKNFRSGWALSAGLRYNVMMDFNDCPLGGIFGISYSPEQIPPPPPPPKPEPPRIISLDCQSSATSCNALTLTLKASDPDNDIVEYRWTASCGTISGSGSTVTWEAPCPCQSSVKQVCTITAEVRDKQGLTATASCPITVICPVETPKSEPLPPTFKGVTFAPGGTYVNNIAKANLDELALQLKNNPRLYVIIQGHADGSGSEKANLQVGLKRANNVRDYLVKRHGIDPKRLETLSLGSSKPIAGSATSSGKAQNNGVDFLVENR